MSSSLPTSKPISPYQPEMTNALQGVEVREVLPGTDNPLWLYWGAPQRSDPQT
jgi:hypothetical protein